MSDTAIPEREPDVQYQRSFQLVGEFMWHWASLEAVLNRGVTKLLSLGILEGAILTANLQVRDKIHIIRTAVDMWGLFAPAEMKAAGKLLDTVAAAAGERNLVAHNPFGPGESGGVSFAITKAKGKLDFPDTVWSEADFSRKFAAMDSLEKSLRSLVRETAAAKDRVQARRAGKTTNALWQPTAGYDGQGVLATLNHLFPTPLGSPTPTAEAGLPEPQAPRPKPKGSRKKK